MTDRERWTVYPLLFLALALTLRDRIFPPGPSSLVARELTIVDEQDRPSILMRGAGQDGSSPTIEIRNSRGNPAWVVSVGGRDGIGIENTGSVICRDVRVLGADGKARVVHGVSADGQGAGRTEWFDAAQNLVLAAGGSDTEGGAVSSFRPGNVPQFSFGSNPHGSVVIVRDVNGRPYFVLMGDDQGEGRAFLFDGKGSGHLLVGQPVNIQLNQVPTAEGEQQRGAETPPATEGETPPEGEPGTPAAETPPAGSDAPSNATPSDKAPNDTAPQGETPPTETPAPAPTEAPAQAAAETSPER